MNEIGFLRLARKFFHSDLWMQKREFSDAEAWLDMLSRALYEPERKVICNGQAVSLQRGELVGSIRFLADRWAWSRGRTERFLNALSQAGRVTFRDDNGTGMRVARLCNWELYNPPRDKLGTGTGPPLGHPRDNIEEGKDGEEVEQRTNPGARDLKTVLAYAAVVGCLPVEAERFWNHFEASGWIDKNGHRIRDWRAKLRVWSADSRARPLEAAHKATGDRPEPRQRPLSVSDMRTVLQAKDDESRALKDRHCSQVAMGEAWDSEEAKQRYFALRKDMKALRIRISNLA